MRTHKIVVCDYDEGKVHHAACLPGEVVVCTLGGLEFIPDDMSRLECPQHGENMVPTDGTAVDAIPFSERTNEEA